MRSSDRRGSSSKAGQGGSLERRKSRQEALRNMYITIAAFLLLSLLSIMLSGAPFKIHAVDITALFIAFFIPNLMAKHKEGKKQIYIWLFGGVIGLLYWDVLSTLVIVKKEIFMGWYSFYPAGIAAILLLQISVKYIHNKLFYTPGIYKDRALKRPPGQ